MQDDLGNRMKLQYENRTRYFLPRRTYTIIRLDGKAFHTFTRGMRRPYDVGLIDMMNATTLTLCKEIQGVQLAYTQSDEISLLLTDFDKITTDAWFDGNIQKMVSVAASIATAKFNQLFLKSKIGPNLKEMEEFIFNSTPLAFFDARIFTIPDPIEVENYFIWRQKDAVRNSIAMTAQSLYSHSELNGKSSSEQQEMIHAKGKNWNDMIDGFKRGRTFYKIPVVAGADGMTAVSTTDFVEMAEEYGMINRKEWAISFPDFLKERELLITLIPKISLD
jgi:tRNA(His) guanylyltransferase